MSSKKMTSAQKGEGPLFKNLIRGGYSEGKVAAYILNIKPYKFTGDAPDNN
jgi:hypothetical protein